MRNIIFRLFIFVLTCLTSCSSNKIDLIKTDKEVFDFVRQFFLEFKGKGSFEKRYYEAIRTVDSLKAENWIKTDIDNNGETDLLVFRAEDLPKIFAILSINGKYKMVQADYWCKFRFIYPVVSSIDKQNIILLYNQELGDYDNSLKKLTYSKLSCDTLIIKENLFLNYIKTERNYNIEKIEIRNDGICEGDCPQISIFINPKTFENKCSKTMHWDLKNKTASGQLNQDQIKKILSLLNYSNFTELKSYYNVKCTDQTTTTLTVTYDGGQIKTIEDYGSTGNFTLAEIYNIARDVKWKE